jgi:DNA-binding MarR family transcriptional regulator
MAEMTERGYSKDDRILLGILESVERDGTHSQRRLASDLDVALGLINAYVKRCVKKGLMKVSTAPARRYAYYLTPQGFAEKSRLTAQYFSYSFTLFRQARADCTALFGHARSLGYAEVVLAGLSDVAEIAVICALETDVKIVAVVDDRSSHERFVGVPVVSNFEAIGEPFDAVIVCDLETTKETVEGALRRYGAARVLVPALLARWLKAANAASEGAQ